MKNFTTNETTTSTTVRPATRVSCTKCGKSYRNNSKLNRHIREIHEASSALGYNCNFCAKNFKRQEHLNRHVRAKHLNLRFRCSLCPRELLEKTRMKLHFINIHKLVRCHGCGVFIEKQSEAGAHICSDELHNAPLSKVNHGVFFDCLRCKLCFLSQGELRAHEAICEGLSKITFHESEGETSATSCHSDCNTLESPKMAKRFPETLLGKRDSLDEQINESKLLVEKKLKLSTQKQEKQNVTQKKEKPSALHLSLFPFANEDEGSGNSTKMRFDFIISPLKAHEGFGCAFLDDLSCLSADQYEEIALKEQVSPMGFKLEAFD